MSESGHATAHRALADAHRVRIVDELDRHPAGLGVTELARILGLHSNTVRWHLGVLTDAGFLSSRVGEHRSTGRPPTIYTLRTDTDAAGGREGNFRLLATVATGIVNDLPDADDRACAAGRAWGRYLVRRPRPGSRMSEADVTDAVVKLLAAEGFRPEARQREIRMHRCPFRELVEAGNTVVCTIHRGLISGALAELGGGLEVERLDVFVEPQLCTAHLAPTAETAPAAAASPGS